MINIDEEAPFIEEPNPRFGTVLSKLNEIRYHVEDNTANFNGNTSEKLLEFTRSLQSFVNDVVVPMDAHINAKGAVHNEDKATVGLGLKDNYPAATLTQQLNLEDVNAFVTAQGAKQAVNANPPNYDPNNYQRNDVLRLSSYYFPDQYPTLIPTVPEPVRYLPNAKLTEPVSILLNNDRLLYATWQDTPTYKRNSMFLSGPTKIFDSVTAIEIQNVNVTYKAKGWGHRSGVSSDGKVNLYHPLLEKNIHGYKTNLTLPTSALTSYLLYDKSVGAVFKGIAVAVTIAGTDITFNSQFFKVDNFNTDPTLTSIIDDSYTVVFKRLGTESSGPARGNHTVKVSELITLPTGSSVTVGGSGLANSSLIWASRDIEAYLFVAVPITIRYADNSVKFQVLNFIVSIAPGTLTAGGSAVFKLVGGENKDVFPDSKADPVNPRWTEPNDPWNINSTVHSPGIVLDGGNIVKAKTTKYSLKLKRYGTGLADLASWMVGPRPNVAMNRGSLSTIVPARHNAFGPLPERIIPVSQNEVDTTYLVFGLNSAKGRYFWHEYTWTALPVTGDTTGGKTVINSPTKETKLETLTNFPAGISCWTNDTVGSVTLSPLVFTKANGYSGFASIQYADSKVTLGAAVKLAPFSLTTLNAMVNPMLARSKTRNPTITDSLREGQVAVYALPSNKALYLVSDGVSSVEGGVVNYTVANGTLTLDFTTGHGGTPILLANVNTVEGASRKSGSGDGVQLDFTDLLVHQLTADSYAVVINRPFGEVYGDISFTLTGYTAAKPTVTQKVINQARLYYGTSTIDVVDELYPSFNIPGVGLYQYDKASTNYNTLCKNVNVPADIIDPFDLNDVSYVFVPAGVKVILNGRSYSLNNSFSVKVAPTGVNYCYLVRTGAELSVIASSVLREPSNNEVMFGISRNGVLEMLTNYLVIDGHTVSATRQGSAIPFFTEDGATGTNQFFTRRDRI